MSAIDPPSHRAIIRPWLFQVSTYPDESFGHFLGRFRRANDLSSAQLSGLLSVAPYLVAYWEAPSRRRSPSSDHLEALSSMTGVSVSQLRQMLWPEHAALHLGTRLCPYCYAQAPYHRLSWQDAAHSMCDRHQSVLLSVCPQCQSDFLLPSYWSSGQCQHCGLPFTEMRPLGLSPIA